MASQFGRLLFRRGNACVRAVDVVSMKPHPCPTYSSMPKLRHSTTARWRFATVGWVGDHNSDAHATEIQSRKFKFCDFSTRKIVAFDRCLFVVTCGVVQALDRATYHIYDCIYRPLQVC